MKKCLRQLSKNERKDRKRGEFLFAWLGHYIVSEFELKGVTTLKKQDGKILKVKIHSLAID